MAASALEVLLGGFPFTAFGHQTETGWTTVDGIPAVEATWWAGGLRVTEQLLALADQRLFLRRIQLALVNLGGPENITLRLALPPGPCKAARGWFVRENAQCRMAGPGFKRTGTGDDRRGAVQIGPLHVATGQTVTVNTLLLAQIPAAQAESWSPLTAAAAGSSVSPGAENWRSSRLPICSPKRGKPGPRRLPCGRATPPYGRSLTKRVLVWRRWWPTTA